MKVLQSGIDSLVIGYKIHDFLEVDEFEELRIAKLKAQEKQFDASGTPVTWFDIEFMVKPRGSRGYEYILENADFTVCIAIKPHDGQKMPEIYATFRSEALWRETPPVLVGAFKRWLEKWAVVVGELVSRCDLCMDLELDFPEINVRKQVITYAHNRIDHADVIPVRHYMNGSKSKEYFFGSGALVGRFYDKIAEVKVHQKEYMLDIYKTRGWDGETGVTRAEFQMRREYLRDCKQVTEYGEVIDKGIDTFDELIVHLPDLWRYLTGKWLRICHEGNRNHNQSKWRVLEFWKLIQNSYELYGKPHGLLRRKVKNVKYDHLFTQGKGIISSMTAVRASGEGEAIARYAVRNELRAYLDSEEYSEDVKSKVPAFSNMVKPDTHLVDEAIRLGARIVGIEESK